MPWKKWSKNAGAKILSFVVAGVLWFSVTNRIDFEDTVEFPVEYVNPPAGLASIEPLPQRVRTRVHGKGKFLRYRLRDGVCRVDLAGFQTGQNRITFTGEDLVLPEDVEVSRVEVLEPRRVTVEFDETVQRDVAIVPAVVGSPDPRYVQVGRTFLNPARAQVKGPRKLVDEIALVHTREIDIDGKKSTVRKHVRLVPPDSPTVEIAPVAVDVGITIEPIVAQRIARVALRGTGDVPAGMQVVFDPPEAGLEIEGARPVVEVVAREGAVVLSVEAEGWVQGGRTLLRVREIRGGEIRFEPVAPSAAAPSGERNRPHGQTQPPPGPAAVRGNVVGRVALPPDVEILSLDPDRILVYVGAAGPPRARGTP